MRVFLTLGRGGVGQLTSALSGAGAPFPHAVTLTLTAPFRYLAFRLSPLAPLGHPLHHPLGYHSPYRG